MTAGAAELRAALACGRPGCACGRRGSRSHCPLPNHGRGRGDWDPSLGVTERGGRLLVVCRVGCPQGDVVGELRALGVWPAPAPRRARGSLRSSVHALVLQLARRQPWAQRGVLAAYRAADAFRHDRRLIAEARESACLLGPSAETWRLLDRAAAVERDAHATLATAEAAAFGEAR